MKKCITCKLDKSIEEFGLRSKSKDGLNPSCKECIRKIDNINYIKYKNTKYNYIIKNKNEIYNYNKIWVQENKEKFKHNRKLWNQNNKESILEYTKKYSNYRYKNDPNFKLGAVLRNNVKNGLKKQKAIKLNKTLVLTGCSIKFLKQHLEKQFKPEMNWNNHGEIWEIDHIIPVSRFDLTNPKQQQKCFHYTNLQPLFKTTEVAKQFGYLNEIGNRNKSSNI